MTSFVHALVRPPGASLASGLTTARLGPPDIDLALQQHSAYVAALAACGLTVTVLPPDEAHPDSTFVEDTALLVPGFALLTRPGAASRQGETASMKAALGELRDSLRPSGYKLQLRQMAGPGTLDGGDVMTVDNHCYIGLSERTTGAGAGEMLALLAACGCTASTVGMAGMLHLKTGLNYLADGVMLVHGPVADSRRFNGYQLLQVPDDEAYAANSLWLNGTVLVPYGFPKTLAMVRQAGFDTLEVPVSEFQKVDGGLSCLSLRLPLEPGA